MTVTTSEDLAIMQDRVAVNMRKIRAHPKGWLEGDDSPDLGMESELQKKIVADAKSKGWPCLSFRQSKKARGYLEPGWPDITLCLPHGRVVFMELKTAKGVLRDKQHLIFSMLPHLGHEVYVVRSFKKYLEIIKRGNDGKQRA